MKRILFFAAITTVVLSSCSTAYQAGQTPDDLYYSPGRVATDAATVKDQRRSQQEQDEYQEYVSSSDDRYLRMKVANRNQWESIDNYSYWNDSRYDFNAYNYSSFNNNFNYYNPYFYSSYYYSMINPYYIGPGFMLGLNYYGAIGSGYGSRYGLGYNPYGYSPYYNIGWGNPLYTVIGYGTPKAFGGTSTPIANINAYRNHYINNTNSNYSSYTGAQTSFSNLVKRVFTNGSNGNPGSSYERAARSFSTPPSSQSTPAYTPSSSNGTSSSAGGNSGGFKSTGSSSSTGRGGKG